MFEAGAQFVTLACMPSCSKQHSTQFVRDDSTHVVCLQIKRILSRGIVPVLHALRLFESLGLKHAIELSTEHWQFSAVFGVVLVECFHSFLKHNVIMASTYPCTQQNAIAM
jgi:hypothetical protein